jgi:site-specific recombinase
VSELGRDIAGVALALQSIPDRLTFGSSLAPDAPNHRCIAQLHGHLVTLEAGAPLSVQVEMFERLGRWVTAGLPPPSSLWVPPEPPAVARLRVAITALERFPELRSRWVAGLGVVLSSSSGVKLFAETGMPNDRGLMQETADRLARRFLPRPPEHGQLAELFARIFRGEKDATWIPAVPDDLFARLATLFGNVWRPAHDWMVDAIALIATRVSALGLSEDMREDDPGSKLRSSPFFRLPRANLDELPGLMVQCRLHADEVLHQLEHHGVSVDVVYCLDVIRLGIDRIELLLPLVEPSAEGDRLPSIRNLLAALAASRVADRSLRGLMRNNLRLLARKVIERAGQTGEHYVTASRREWWGMIGSAAGGGVLTVGTIAIKFMTKWQHYPLFVDGMLSAANYAASFIVMQLCGFTLATKQPSMTAAMLAGSIREARGPERLDELVSLIARISRSQFAAACGNVLMVIPAAIAFNYLWSNHYGQDFLDAADAGKAIASFHPLKSGTIPFAALTGVLLWMSSLGAGWLENWTTYRRLPEAIEHHRIGRVIGTRNTARISRFLARNISGFGGNATLGFLLGMTPVMGVFFGLPLDVRHVTLSTGSLTLAGISFGQDMILSAPFIWASIGIIIIGLLNFGVSFVFALTVAFRARDVTRRERLTLWRAVGRRFLRSPFEFFYPPRGAQPAAHHGH